jgi:UDPglucose 6-dehydrogenase
VKVLMVGSGYVGLVSGACLAELGHSVVCVDRDTAKIDQLRAGRTPIFEPGLGALITKNTAAGRLSFETSLLTHSEWADAVFIAVGTPPCEIDQSADLSSVFAVAEELARATCGRLVVVVKSTVPVGTGEAIERTIQSLSPRLSVSVVSNPEFLREGQAIGDFMSPDRIVVGAEDDRGRDTLTRLYAPLTRRGAKLMLTRRRAAELVKYASNAFLATKISFINEMADLCEAVDADIDEVAAVMGLDQRIGSAFLKAGPGFGGSCFPKDCHALLETARQHNVNLQVVASASATNDDRKLAMTQRIINAMGGDVRERTISVLGLTFKAGTDDIREAAPIQIVKDLVRAGATVKVYDPYGMSSGRRILKQVEFSASAIDCCAGADGVVVATEWDHFRALSADMLAEVMAGRTVIDLRNIVDRKALSERGFTIHSIGRRPERPTRAGRRRVGAKLELLARQAISPARSVALEERPYLT